MFKNNPTTIKIVLLNYPLQKHKFAVKAAVAALAAGRQGKFWEFHDELFKVYQKINDEKIQQIAQQLGLDQIQFKKDQTDPVILKKIQQDYQQAVRLGVNGVPAVFINGKQTRARTLGDFQIVIDQELKKQRTH